MIFVGLLSVVFLKKRLEWFRWTGMAVVVCGIAMVGWIWYWEVFTGEALGGRGRLHQDWGRGGGRRRQQGRHWGHHHRLRPGNNDPDAQQNVWSKCSQLVAACQFVYEEKYITKYDIHPLKVIIHITNYIKTVTKHFSALIGDTLNSCFHITDGECNCLISVSKAFCLSNIDFSCKKFAAKCKLQQFWVFYISIWFILCVVKYTWTSGLLKARPSYLAKKKWSNSRSLAVKAFLGSLPWLWPRWGSSLESGSLF